MRLVLTSRQAAMISAYDLIPLHLAPTGQTAHVAQLVGLPAEVHRLHELGLREGLPVEIVQSGTPCIIRFAGHKICFRDSEGFQVLVRLENAP